MALPRAPIAAALRLGFALMLIVPVAAHAQSPLRRGSPASLIRLEGHLGERQPSDKGVTDLRLECRGTTYRYQAADLRVITGDRLGSSILSEVKGYRPNFFLRGGDTMLQRLGSAKPGDRVEITGYFRRGTRDLMVSEIAIGAPPTATPK